MVTHSTHTLETENVDYYTMRQSQEWIDTLETDRKQEIRNILFRFLKLTLSFDIINIEHIGFTHKMYPQLHVINVRNGLMLETPVICCERQECIDQHAQVTCNTVYGHTGAMLSSWLSMNLTPQRA